MSTQARPDADLPPGSAMAAVRSHGLDATSAAAGPSALLADDVRMRVDAERTIGLLAGELARLHEIAPPEGAELLDRCDVAEQVLSAHRAGRLVSIERSEAYRHMGTARLVDLLVDEADVARHEVDAVLTHGSPTYSRLRCDAGAAIGLLDWSAAAWSDPHRDLAAAATDTARTFGPTMVPLLVQAYLSRRGAFHLDPVRLDWWALAHELDA